MDFVCPCARVPWACEWVDITTRLSYMLTGAYESALEATLRNDHFRAHMGRH